MFISKKLILLSEHRQRPPLLVKYPWPHSHDLAAKLGDPGELLPGSQLAGPYMAVIWFNMVQHGCNICGKPNDNIQQLP